jgi:hypothetical protein
MVFTDCTHTPKALGFHSASRPPTWHFYLLDAGKMTPEYLATLDSGVRRMLEGASGVPQPVSGRIQKLAQKKRSHAPSASGLKTGAGVAPGGGPRLSLWLAPR